MKKYDFILIGTGQATGTILPDLIDKKMKTAVVESDKTGGTCVNWGCTPTKTLVASARAAHMVRRASEFGIDIRNSSVNFQKIMKRVNNIRNPATEGFEAWLRDVTDFYAVEGSFADSHTVKVGDEHIYGEKIIIHTGTRARTPRIAGIDTVPWLDNKGILALEELPEHLIVVGASYIGLEFAQAFHRLGSRVTVVGRGERIIPREDPDISDTALQILTDEGLVFHLNAGIKGLEKSGDGVRVNYSRNGKTESLEGSQVLLAVGRVPNTDMLNLSAAGVKTNERGFIEVNDVGQSSVPYIYALGDVNGGSAFTHTSVHDGQVFLEHLNGGAKVISDRIPIHSMFIDPPLARVGMTELEAARSGLKIQIATRKMSAINRAREKDETGGMIKLIVDKNSLLILGATVFGVGGDEVISMLALAMQARLPYTKIQETVIPHPTVSELVPWIFADLGDLQDN